MGLFCGRRCYLNGAPNPLRKFVSTKAWNSYLGDCNSPRPQGGTVRRVTQVAALRRPRFKSPSWPWKFTGKDETGKTTQLESPVVVPGSDLMTHEITTRSAFRSTDCGIVGLWDSSNLLPRYSYCLDAQSWLISFQIMTYLVPYPC